MIHVFWVVCEEGMDRPLVWHHPPPPRNPQKATRVFRVEVPLPDVDKVDAVLRVHPMNVKLRIQEAVHTHSEHTWVHSDCSACKAQSPQDASPEGIEVYVQHEPDCTCSIDPRCVTAPRPSEAPKEDHAALVAYAKLHDEDLATIRNLRANVRDLQAQLSARLETDP